MPNLGLVVRLAKQYRRNGLDLPEAIAIGNLALTEAAHSYKRVIKEPFEAYAAGKIRRNIAHSLAASPLIGGVRNAPLGPEERLIIRERLERLESQLTPRELQILSLYFEKAQPLEEIGKKFQASRETVRLIRNSVLDELSSRTPALPNLKAKRAKVRRAPRTIMDIESVFAGKGKEVRDIVMFLAWQLLQDRGISIHSIGYYFRIGPATVKSKIKATEARYAGDGAFRDFIDEVKARLGINCV